MAGCGCRKRTMIPERPMIFRKGSGTISSKEDTRPTATCHRATKELCDEGRGVGPGGRGVYLDLTGAIELLGADVIRDRYGNIFDMYERITGEHAYQQPMRISPPPPYTIAC